MNTLDIIKNFKKFKNEYSDSEFPFDYFFELSEKFRLEKHIYNIVDKINKKDKLDLSFLDPGSDEYSRRKFLLDNDNLDQQLRLKKIEEMSNEITFLTEKFKKLSN